MEFLHLALGYATVGALSAIVDYNMLGEDSNPTVMFWFWPYYWVYFLLVFLWGLVSGTEWD